MSGWDARVAIVTEADLTGAILACDQLCRQVGLRDDQRCRLSTAVSELGRNILRYAGRGEILLRRVQRGHRDGIEVRATDRGPGIEDPEEALRDHVSSMDSLGLGLPGVKRLSDEFDLDTTVGKGTTVTAVMLG